MPLPISQTLCYSQFPHGLSQYDLGKCSQGSQSAEKHMALTLEISSSVQTWSPLILEPRQLLIDRCMKTFSFLPFINQRNIGFPAFCLLSETHCLEILAWRSFLSNNFPSTLYSKDGPQIIGERKISNHLFHDVFSIAGIQ